MPKIKECKVEMRTELKQDFRDLELKKKKIT